MHTNFQDYFIDEYLQKSVALVTVPNFRTLKIKFPNATIKDDYPSLLKEFLKNAVIMKMIKNKLLNNLRLPLTKVDPNFILLILVIVFFVLLVAAENVIKHTLIPQ